ncbi:VanW family protein [Marininema halotolerans]|uniref:Vancomycin resistance protein YoaR, contains peptidoglycan-binding and VanW domains n=1 Tax=Marininema halotolerans TaxID=1155944 RepID=A0A1I6SSB5_9BACL|nr:VanW family protein [Marininema halotolerans]SFS79852.1 Vancomycin resistance protein YoaR, contains peptidoglycan-binding and VanW domains [Marininema halotolerans]
MRGHKTWVWILTLSIISGCTLGKPSSSAKELSSTTEKKKPTPVQSQSESKVTPSWLKLSDGENVWKVDLSQMGYDGIDPTSLDRTAFHRWLNQVQKEINRAPRNARLEDDHIVPHTIGQKLDREVVEQWLDDLHEHTNKVEKAPILPWRPRVTTAMLKHIREKKLGSYTTRYNPYHWNRSHNIDLSVHAIHNHVIPSGDTFSFNQTVGIRSAKRGYRPATVIVRGEYTEGIGGGICQTSSTLYNSVARAGLRILQRSSHSKHVTYVPVGQDATVSWGGPDFRFQNQLNRPVLIRAVSSDGWLTVSIYGAADTVYHPRETPDPPQKEPQTEEVPNPDEKQPLDQTEKEYENSPLPSTDSSNRDNSMSE